MTANRPPHSAVALSGFGLALLLAAAIAGLRLNDRGPSFVGQRDPNGTLKGFDVPADRLADASFVTDLAVAPDGAIFYVEHLTGRVGRLSPTADGGLEDSTVAQFELPEAGRLFHLALHPDWPAEPVLYVTAHEGVGPDQRLALFRVTVGDEGPGAIERLVGGLPTEDPGRGARADHYGSALAVCDGFVYLSVGDTDSPGPGSYRPGGIRFRAQDPTHAEGKILRYRLDGREIEPAGVTTSDPPVYALGFRNVFAMDCDPTTGWPVAVDNGSSGYDQVRRVEPGSNHEWPLSDERDEVTPPWFTSGRAALAPTGLVARPLEAGGAEILFGSFHLEAVYALQISADGAPSRLVSLQHQAQGAPLSLASDADGCIYLGTTDGIWLLRESFCRREAVVGSNSPDPQRFSGQPAEVYRANCAPCHGLDREGGEAPPLLNDRLRDPDEFYLDTILAGRADKGMPSWAVAGMSGAQARAMLEYLRSAPE